MRIALDARTVYADQRRGTGRNLVDLYRQLVTIRPDWQLLAYHRREHTTPVLPPAFARPMRIDMMGDRVDAWQRWRLPFAAWRAGADVLHCPANLCPSWMPLPTIVTIHDLIPLDLPMAQPAGQVRRFEQSVRQAVRHATRIITPSRYTRDRLVNEFAAAAERMMVIPWAPDQSIQLQSPDRYESVLPRFGIRRPYVMHFGAPDQRKNTRRVIEAWSMIDRSLRSDWQLLVVGLDPVSVHQMGKYAMERDSFDSVRLHAFIRDVDMAPLLSGADVLAYPSLSEGFGLPMLDAWVTRTAVLTSNTTSLPEVAGDAAILVDPTDACAIAGGMTKLINGTQLRTDLVAAGRRRLKKYTWQATAERFAFVVEQAGGLMTDYAAAA